MFDVCFLTGKVFILKDAEKTPELKKRKIKILEDKVVKQGIVLESI